MKTVICMATFRRPEGLARLLEGLNVLEVPAESPEIELVVVDNDTEGSGRETCDRLRATIRWPVSYYIESHRGIASARNKALASVDPTADWIAFIDDDEVPAPNWLVELFRVQRKFDAAVVTGPVLPHFEDDAPDWVRKGGFFDPPRHETGHRLNDSATNNVLFRADIVRGMDRHFDVRFGLTGGEDAHFFRRVALAGHKIVWAASGVVHESVPNSRTTAKWLILRLFRAGNSSTAIELDLFPGVRTLALSMTKGLVWVLIGLALTPWGLVSGRANLVKAVRYLAFGVGRLAGLAGVRYEEYRTTHGTGGDAPPSEDTRGKHGR